jgi:hypothetical protein
MTNTIPPKRIVQSTNALIAIPTPIPSNTLECLTYPQHPNFDYARTLRLIAAKFHVT